MVKKTNKNKKQVTRTIVVSSLPRPKNRSKKKKSSKINSILDVRVARWDQLLRDPCSAQMAQPCYGGIDSGYFLRTTDILPLGNVGSGLTSGATYFSDMSFQYTPFNVSSTTGIVATFYAGNGQTLTSTQTTGVSNFISTSNAVKRYRPIACCCKFIPTGPYSTRAGMIALGIAPGMIENVGDTVTVSNMLALAQHTVNVGAEAHEVRWLPTMVDEVFTSIGVNNTAAGSVFFTLKNVDGVATSATQITINGYVEMTTCWEWIPAALNSVSVAPSAPLPYTSQQVLATISDMGAYIFHGVRRIAGMPGVVNGAVNVASRLLSGGMTMSSYRGPGIPTYRY